MVRILFLVLFLSGCTTIQKEPIVQIKTVEVPVYSCPEPIIVSRPQLFTDNIKESDDIGEIVAKYKATIRVLLDYSNSLEQSLSLYKKP